MDFLNIVLLKLKENKITLYELGKKTGIKDNTLSNWKTGKSKNLSFENSLMIAKILNISIDEMIGLKEKKLSDKDNELLSKYKQADEGTRKAVDKLLDIQEDTQELLKLKIG